MQLADGRAGRNAFCVSLGELEIMGLVIMYQSTETEQLNRPELKGTISDVIKPGWMEFLLCGSISELSLGGRIRKAERFTETSE